MKDALKLYVKKGNYGWFTAVDNGKSDAERLSYFMEVVFKQGAEPAVSPCRIDVGHCFLSCYNTKGGVKPKIVITEYEIEKTFENNGGVAPAVPAASAAAAPVASVPSAPNVYHAPAAPDPVMPYDPHASGSYSPAAAPLDEDIPF